MTTRPLVDVSHVSKTYYGPRSHLFGPRAETRALDDVSMKIAPGESVAIVGESGSGKTTLLRAMLGLTSVSAGEVRFDGQRVLADPKDRMLWLRRRTGLVFQDPYATFNPRRTVGQSVAEPLEAIDAPGDHRALVQEMLARMHLPADSIDRYPHAFSGGQRQRIALARALVHGPDMLVGDEPVSALDVLIRTQMIDLLNDLRHEFGLTLVTVTHDLAVVPKLADRIVVMRSGRIVETGTVQQIFQSPHDPYTQDLIRALPRLPKGFHD